MRPGAKRHARIQPDDDGRRLRRHMPRRHDPEPVADAGRRKLRLRRTHPVGILTGGSLRSAAWPIASATLAAATTSATGGLGSPSTSTRSRLCCQASFVRFKARARRTAAIRRACPRRHPRRHRKRAAASNASASDSACCASARRVTSTQHPGLCDLARRDALFQVMDAGAAEHEFFIHQQFTMQRDVGLDSLDDHLRKRDRASGPTPASRVSP